MSEETKVLNSEEITYTTNPSENQESENIAPKSEEAPIEIKEEFIKPKKSILFKILIGIISLLIVIIIIGAISFFTGFFDHKEEAPHEQNIEQTHTENPPHENKIEKIEKVETKDEGYKFNLKDINSKKLNEQLASLTNKNIEKKKIEETKTEETPLKINENELIKQKEELEKQKTELEKIKKEQDSTQSEEKKPEEIEKKDLTKETTNKNEFLLFINVVKIKGVLYKKYLDKIVEINPNLKLCRDEKNRIEIYYGPFVDSKERTELLDKLIKNKFTEAYELEFTQEEFNKRCNY